MLGTWPKYRVKGEPRSQTIQSIFKSCVNNLGENIDTNKVFKRAMCIQLVKEVLI